MDPVDLKARIDDFAGALAEACAVFDVPSDDALDRDADFLFEVLAYFALVAGVRGATLSCTPGKLAETPHPRTDRMRFRATLASGEKYDMCQGTQLRDVHGTLRAPDIQIQTANEDPIPPFDVLVAIWDAKHREGSSKKRIRKEEFFQFVGFMDVLDVPDIAAGDLLERLVPPAFRVSALLTNGLGPTEKNELLIETGVSIVAPFCGDGSLAPVPTAEEHLGAAARPRRPKRRPVVAAAVLPPSGPHLVDRAEGATGEAPPPRRLRPR